MNDPRPSPTDPPCPEIQAVTGDASPTSPEGTAAPREIEAAPATITEAMTSPTPPSPTHARLLEFHRTLRELTPRVYVSPVLVAINLLVYVLMVMSGVDWYKPTIADLLRWGANYGPQTTGGEWWRLLSSAFVHIGLPHILLNMFVLATAGPLVERMVGSVGFLLLYLLAGLTGSLASILWNPVVVSAGASGAIFGVYGALVAILLRNQGSIPAEIQNQLLGSGVGFLVLNLLFGAMVSEIDNAAHVGGLIGGFLGGLVLSQPFAPSARSLRPFRNALLVAVGAIVVAGGMFGVQSRNAELSQAQMELDGLPQVEKKSVDALNAAQDRLQRGELTDAQFADVLERDVITGWRAARERLAAFGNLPPKLQNRVAAILEYMRAREESWVLFAEAYREGNPQKIQQAIAKTKLAEEAARRMNSK